MANNRSSSQIKTLLLSKRLENIAFQAFFPLDRLESVHLDSPYALTLSENLSSNYSRLPSFLAIEKLIGDSYLPIAQDWDPETTYRWERSGVANSKVTISWDTLGVSPGTYRIRHSGDHKSGWTGAIKAYEGVSTSFSLN